MSSAGNDLREHSLEPVYYVPNQRAEWRLGQNKIYSTDMFLSNLGVTKTDRNTGSHYSAWAGVYGTVTQMTLYDGNVVLSQISDVGRWAGFKMFNKSNDYNQSVGQYMSLANNSVRMGNTDARPLQDFCADKRTNAVSSGKPNMRALGERIQDGLTRDMITKPADTGAAGTAKGQLRCRHIFDLLNQLPYIDTSIFKEFRVVVELSADPLRVTRSNQNGALTTCRPLLLVTELIDDELKSGLMGKSVSVSFNEIEDDRVRIPRIESCYTAASIAVATINTAGRNPRQDSSFHINGFNNKTLGKILLWKAPVDQYQIGPVFGDRTGQQNPAVNSSMQILDANRGGIVGLGQYASTGFLGEQEQIRINGRNIFARSGIVGDNRRLASMVDSWGNCAMHPFAQGLAYTEVDGVDRSQYLTAEGNSGIGVKSFVGVDLAGERCTDMQIDFTRVGQFMSDSAATENGTGAGGQAATVGTVNRTKYNQNHDLLIWCEVKKAIVPDPSQAQGYTVQYV